MNGRIYTFYSYKGGVGRTMALANIAMYLFQRRSLNVLMIDWDLEAPGLERYFESHYDLSIRKLGDQRGLADLIQDYQANVSKPPASKDASPYPVLNDRYLYTFERRGETRLQLMTAGRRGSDKAWNDYAGFVQGFDWNRFYTEWAGGGFINWLRDEVRKLADVILIDSRTGMTEMGGVATQQMADVAVLMFAPNAENMENSLRVANSFVGKEVSKLRKGQPLQLITVPSRVDNADSANYPEFRKRVRAMFGELQLPEFGRDPLYEMTLPYLPKFSYREALLFGDLENEIAGDVLVKGYTQIASNMIALAPDDHIMRRGHVQRGKVYISYTSEMFSAADEIRRRLSERDINVQDNFHPDTWDANSEDDDERQVETSQSVIVLIDPKSARSKSVRRCISLAEQLQKPIIPILLAGDNDAVPFDLRPLRYLDWRDPNRPWDTLFESLEAYFRGESIKEVTRGGARKRSKHIYISYSGRDSADISYRLFRDLVNADYNVFLDTTSILGGQEWQNVTTQALEQTDVILTLISPKAAESRFVQSELFYALDHKKRIIPLLVVPDTLLPALLSSLQTIDFTKGYEKAFHQLLEALSDV